MARPFPFSTMQCPLGAFRYWLPALALSLLGVGARAETSTGPAPKGSPALRAEARERFDRGLRLFEQGDNASALAEFKRANELVANPLVLYNMGLVYAAMNRPVESADTLGAFLAQSGGARREQRKHAEAVREEQAGRVARLVVETQVPAVVEIDGVDAGRTPLAEPIRLASGSHVVGAQAPGYLPARKEITLAGRVTETVSLTLLPTEARMAQLWVSSVPLGAEIRINGTPAGNTPLPASLSVPPGSVRVEARRAGYVTAEGTVVLGDGSRGELALQLLEDPSAPAASKGTLRLLVSEPEAQVTIDGSPVPAASPGRTLPAGPHQLRVTRDGFEPIVSTINLSAGRETSLALDLVPTPETRAHYEAGVRLRRWVGWTVLGAGLGLALGAGFYAGAQLGRVDDSRTRLDAVLANEHDPTNLCYALGADYQARGCGSIKSDAQDRVDGAVLRRNLGLVAAGLGVLTAGIGTYVLLSGPDPNRYRKGAGVALTEVMGWTDGVAGGLALTGRF